MTAIALSKAVLYDQVGNGAENVASAAVSPDEAPPERVVRVLRESEERKEDDRDWGRVCW